MVFLLMATVFGMTGCVSQKPMIKGATVEPTPHLEPLHPSGIGKRQVMVECRFTEGDNILSAPKIITLDGQEAQIAISEERSFPGSKEPMELGIKLTILPVVKDGMISYRGSCSVKEFLQIESGTNLRSASIVTRESVFSGAAASGQESMLMLPSIKGEALRVTLKFTLVDEQGSHLGAD
jgi:hypothetical protein